MSTPPVPPIETDRPPAWEILEQALTHQRAVRANYHGQQRLLCPHALGWKNGRAKALIYQAGGGTSTGELPANPQQRWRPMFIDEIEQPAITNDQWQTTNNYTPDSTGIDTIAIAITEAP